MSKVMKIDDLVAEKIGKIKVKFGISTAQASRMLYLNERLVTRGPGRPKRPSLWSTPMKDWQIRLLYEPEKGNKV
jgi:hypothetical protein